jgi:hypothetical protein
MENENNHNKNHIFFKSEIRCQEKPRMQDFSPFTPELLGVLSDPQTPGHKGISLCEVHGLLCNPISAFIFKV